MGYEAMREQTLARQKEMGIVPADTDLPPINPIGTTESRTGPDGKPFPPLDVTRPWDSLNDDEKRLIREREWIELWRHGMSIYTMTKLIGVTDTPLVEIGKRMRESGDAN